MQATRESVNKRKRLTGTSKWTMNSISRRIAERQAISDIDDMMAAQSAESQGCRSNTNTDSFDSEYTAGLIHPVT